jgi:hypothetical protein
MEKTHKTYGIWNDGHLRIGIYDKDCGSPSTIEFTITKLSGKKRMFENFSIRKEDCIILRELLNRINF